MNRKLSFVLYVLLFVVLTALLVMTVVASAGVKGIWSGTPIVIVLSALGIAISVSVVAFNPKKTIYSIGFYVLHIGIVAFLVGMIGYSVAGVETYAAPVNTGSVTSVMEYRMHQMGYTDRQISSLKGYNNRIGGSDGEVIDLGFNFRIIDFKTEYYDDGVSVKHYEATVEFLNSEDGSVDKISLTVNHPIYRNGWKIYLMDVGTNPNFGYQQVQLMFKKDPTEFLSVSGIILTIVGTFMMCLIRPKAEEVASKKGNEKGSVRKAGGKK